jgi:hypothetical protein
MVPQSGPRLWMRVSLPALLAFAAVAAAQTATFHEDTLHGRNALVLENARMRISSLTGGGFIGEIRFKGADPQLNINPMRVPHYQTIDPHTYDIAKHGALYGTDIQRRLMSGYMGQFLCFPHFGPASEAEFKYDLGQHGEAVAVEWKKVSVDSARDSVTLRYAADLPKTQFRVERSITLPADETVAYVEESVENQTYFDRPVEWVQHVTFGPPFIEIGKNFVDAPVAKIVVRNGQASADTWPMVKDTQGRESDMRVFSGRSGSWLMDRSQPRVWFTLYHTGYRVLIGYLFETASNPWVLDWQENQRAQQVPWNGKATARAICIGDSTYGGIRNVVERGSSLGVPVYSWIQAKQRRSQSYTIFLAEIPLGFKGVSELKVEGGRIALTERETGKTTVVRSSRLR